MSGRESGTVKGWRVSLTRRFLPPEGKLCAPEPFRLRDKGLEAEKVPRFDL